MTTSRRSPIPSATARRAPAHAADRPESSSSFLELLLLGFLLTLIPLRGVLPENLSLELPDWTRHLDAPVGPLPATSMVLDGLIFASAVALASIRLWKPASAQRFRPTGAEGGAILLLIAGIISTLYAGQKRWAISGTVDFLALLLYLILLRQLLTSAWRIRLCLSVILATGAVIVTKCFYQVFVEFPDTIDQFRKSFAPLLQAGAAPADLGQYHDLRQRLLSQAATGFFTHANVAATYLATLALVTIATIVTRLRSSPLGWKACVAPAVLGLAALGSLRLAQSKGAIAAFLAGIALWAIWIFFGGWIKSNPRRALVTFWCAILVGALGIVAIGLSTGRLPSKSMLFRWQYWRGAAAIMRDHGQTGVGAGNFGRHFMQYKPVECPEEVQDPHSWLVRAATEWGWLGAVGIILVWVGISVVLARPPAIDAPPAAERLSHRFMPPWVIGITLAVCAGLGLIYTGPLGWERHAAYIGMLLIEIAAIWAIAFVLMFVESAEVTHVLDNPLPGLRVGLAIAAIAFILHAAIDLAMFWSGAATLLFALLAMALAVPQSEPGTTRIASPPSPPKRIPAILCGLLGFLLLAACARYCVIPPWRAGHALLTARTADSGTTWDEFQSSGADAAYQRAIAADPLDSVAVAEMLDELLTDRGHPPRIRTLAQSNAALPWIDVLRSRDPDGSAADGFLARLLTIRFEFTHDVADLKNAAAALERNVRNYPTSPHRRIALGQLLARLALVESAAPGADAARIADLRRRAVGEWRTALRLDDERIYISKPNHLSDVQRAQIEADATQLSTGS